ncbi:glycosyl hydrolase 108 family protein [Rhizobium sp. 18065]|uniref:glycosyl hydrolase 108 family protein n=1 Tax=Rhizobium sp. 18065 TaxID=2681411 RepID=UPI001356A5F4|nr:glycosyl hydrolase 108 family protein [Rhizobium sp. 18065]
MDRFAECHVITAGHEGGWSNHKDDPGAATMLGVTQAKFTEMLKKWGKPNRSVRTITRDEALRIYREEYWDKCGAPTLFPGVDLAVYDASVNSGIGRGRKWRDQTVSIKDAVSRVKAICKARLSFMQSLKIWKTFGKGWGRRVADIEVKGVAMALKALGASTADIKVRAQAESKAAAATAAVGKKTEKAVASGGGVSTGGAATVAAETGINTEMLLLLGALGVALIAALIIINVRRRANDERSTAYAALASEAV